MTDDLLETLRGLLVATRMWVRRRPLDARALERAQDEAIEALHRHYQAHIPVYGRLADAAGLPGPAPVDAITRELMVTDELFKSYDPDLVDAGHFAALTDWLGTVFVRRPAIDPKGIGNLATWRARLRAAGIFVACSSGTSGRPSLVPRDRRTLTALRRNGLLYAGEAAAAGHDYLLLTGRGRGLGIEAVARGIAEGGERVEWVDPGVGDGEQAWARGVGFLRAASAAGRTVLVFGPPAAIQELCARAEDERLGPLRPGSLVVTGGGWKGRMAVDPEALRNLAVASLGVALERVIDIYGASELNSYLVRCPNGRYHVPPLLRAVVLDDLLEPVAGDDVIGLLGFLDVFALSYPGFVIPGDTGRLVNSRCPCGLDGWAVVGTIERAPRSTTRGCADVTVSA